jgi:CzcA family heavy metal efflux pump
MLQTLVAWSLRYRFAVVVFAALLLVVGIWAAARARLDVFPEFAPPLVVIQTEAPGLAPSDVEQMVTLPIEVAINGVPRLALLRSQSIQGLAVVTAFFQDGTDIYRARQQVSERLGELAGQLPIEAKAPRLAPLTSSTGRLLAVGFTSKALTPMELRDRAQWLVRPRLLLPGVAQVTIFGGAVRQFQIQVDADALAARQLTITDVLDTARQATGMRGAGFLENDRQRIHVRSEGQVKSAAELGGTLILTTAGGSPVKLADVARVVDGPEPKFGDALIDGKPGVVLVAYRQLEADTIEVTRRLEAEMDKLRQFLEREGITYHPHLFRQADFIEHALGNVTESLLLGALLVAVVLFLFLFNLRTALISLTAIPLSLLSAVAILWALGVGLNTLTLGGLAIAVGEVVDDAIIDVENIFRRLRENRSRSHPRSAAAVVLTASLEVRGAVVYATFVVVLVFVPVFFLSGLQGRLFAPLGYAYVLAVLASLAVALIVTPALSLVLLPTARASHEPVLLRWLQAGYEWLLRGVDRCWPCALATMLVLLIAAGVALSRFGGAFLPELRESHFVLHMRGMPGMSLPASRAMGQQAAVLIKQHPAVAAVTQNIGRAELGEDTWGVEYSEIEIPLKLESAAEVRSAQAHLEHVADRLPGYRGEVYTFLSERIKELLAGTPAAVAVRVYGESFDDIERAAAQIARVMNTTDGHANVYAEAQSGVPEVVVRPRPNPFLRRVQIIDAVQTALQGTDVGQVHIGPRTIDVRVLLDERFHYFRHDPAAIGELWLSVPGSDDPRSPGRVPLKQVADVFRSDGRFLIAHEGGLRRQQVTCNVTGRDVTGFVSELERRLRELDLPPGVYYTLAGEHEARATAQRELLFWSSMVAVAIVLLLWLAYGTLGRVLLILVNLPFAMVGGVMAVALTGGVLDVGSLIGFVTLLGITTRNSMMLVSHWQHLAEQEGMPWGAGLIFRGARERLAPVLMTALVTGLGLLPIAWGSGEAGREIEGPMAWVILGGLGTSTVLNLFLLPVIYRRVAARGPDTPGESHAMPLGV